MPRATFSQTRINGLLARVPNDQQPKMEAFLILANHNMLSLTLAHSFGRRGEALQKRTGRPNEPPCSASLCFAKTLHVCSIKDLEARVCAALFAMIP